MALFEPCLKSLSSFTKKPMLQAIGTAKVSLATRILNEFDFDEFSEKDKFDIAYQASNRLLYQDPENIPYYPTLFSNTEVTPKAEKVVEVAEALRHDNDTLTMTYHLLYVYVSFKVYEAIPKAVLSVNVEIMLVNRATAASVKKGVFLACKAL